jgi:glycosyltransferase involved in cell wall biosynthesis
MPTDSPRILHVIARYNLGGTARYLSRLLPELEAANFQVLLAVGRIQAGEVEDSSLLKLNFVRIENLGRRLNLFADVKAFFRIKALIKEFKPDVIHSHTFKAGLLCRLLVNKIPKVHTFHGHLLADPEFSTFQVKMIVIFERLLAKNAQRLVTTGRNVATELLAHGIGKKEDYVSIPGELSPVEFLSRDIARQNLDLNKEFVIVWIARVVPVKNARLLVEVARLLPDCTFIMAGDGVDLHEIRVLAPPNLRVLGYVPASDILLAGDLFLSTSLNEGFPYSVLEAKIAGLPIVAVDVGSISEIILHGVDGFLVGASPNEIKDRIVEIKHSTAVITGDGVKAGKFSEGSDPATGMISKHIELYNNVLYP